MSGRVIIPHGLDTDETSAMHVLGFNQMKVSFQIILKERVITGASAVLSLNILLKVVLSFY